MMIPRRAFLKTCGWVGLAVCGPTWAATAQAQSLFDGQSLVGWHKPPKRIGHGTGGHWFVQEGLLVCEQDPPGSGNGGLLLSDQRLMKFGPFLGFLQSGLSRAQILVRLLHIGAGAFVFQAEQYGTGANPLVCLDGYVPHASRHGGINGKDSAGNIDIAHASEGALGADIR